MGSANKIIVFSDEKRLRQIMKELSIHNESIIEDTSGKYNGTMRKLARRGKPLMDKNLLEPIWIQLDNQSNTVQKRLIRIPKDVVVVEKNGSKIDFFHFKKRRVV